MDFMMNKRTSGTTRSRGQIKVLLHGFAALMLCMSFSVGAQQSDSAAAPSNGSAETKQEEPRCIHGCERWGKMCNTDPRGVYKCRRVCEKFGEICE